jgi:hypothetical protein
MTPPASRLSEERLREIERAAGEAIPYPLTFGDPNDENNVEVFWTNPWDGKREAIASLFWPGHPMEDTAKVEAWFEAFGRMIEKANPATVAQMARELREARDLLGTWRSCLKAGADEMECRADEDCDHCFALSLVADTDKLIGGSP